MTVDEMLLKVVWICSDICRIDCFPICLVCVHNVGYDMYALGVDMLETGDNPLI